MKLFYLGNEKKNKCVSRIVGDIGIVWGRKKSSENSRIVCISLVAIYSTIERILAK